MRDLVKQLLDNDMSRREFGQRLLALGFSAGAAQSLVTSVAGAAEHTTPAAYEFTGNGGEIIAECLKAAGVEYVFDANSTGQASFYDAVGQRPELNLIIALQEGQAAAMAHGYELASGRTAALFVASIGMPNTLCNLYNAFKDRSSLLVFSDGQNSQQNGRDGFQQLADWMRPTEQFTKWQWQVKHPDRIAEMTRRGFKLAGTQPGGPVYIKIPRDLLDTKDIKQTIYPQSDFTVPVDMQPRPDVIEEAARLLLEAERPMINVGPEVTRAGAAADVLELAELLGADVSQGFSVYGDFPFSHPLFAGYAGMGFPRGIRRADVFLNLGALMPDESIVTTPVKDSTRVINARLDYDTIANRYPTDIAIAAGLRETTTALVDALKSMATEEQLRALSAPRLEKAEASYLKAKARQRSKADATWNSTPVSAERLCFEMDSLLEEDAIVVVETGGRDPQNWMTFGPGKKQVIGPYHGLRTRLGHRRRHRREDCPARSSGRGDGR